MTHAEPQSRRGRIFTRRRGDAEVFSSLARWFVDLCGAHSRASYSSTQRDFRRTEKNSASPRLRVNPLLLCGSAALRESFFGIVLLASSFATFADAQTPQAGHAISITSTLAVSLTGVKAPAQLWIDDLKKLPQMTVTISQATDHGPVNATFTGALLWTVIDNAGWINGPEKNAYLRHTIIVTGKDGYAAALSEGEIDPKLEGKQVILAVSKDGTPLERPRLVVPGDAHASRSVQDVTAIEIH
jgi:hypothetical protein